MKRTMYLRQRKFEIPQIEHPRSVKELATLGPDVRLSVRENVLYRKVSFREAWDCYAENLRIWFSFEQAKSLDTFLPKWNITKSFFHGAMQFDKNKTFRDVCQIARDFVKLTDSKFDLSYFVELPLKRCR